MFVCLFVYVSLVLNIPMHPSYTFMSSFWTCPCHYFSIFVVHLCMFPRIPETKFVIHRGFEETLLLFFCCCNLYSYVVVFVEYI